VQVVPEKKRKHLKGTAKNYYEAAREASLLNTFSTEDLPEILRRQFRETNGAEGNLVLLFPKNGMNTRDGRVVLKFAKEVRSVALPAGAYVAGSQLVFADMLAAISHDGPIATLFSFAAVVLLSLWLARGSVSGSFLITLALLVGVLWTIALIEVFDIKINFLNFIALPITFGVGLDYAVNVYGRYSQSHHTRHDIKMAIAHSGSAVLVCSGTTIIGYTSLLFSKNGALFSFGTLAIIGEIGCLIAALVVLPAMMKTNKEKRQRSFSLFPSTQSKTS
jgi:predicted RND superfamily exporter protein